MIIQSPPMYQITKKIRQTSQPGGNQDSLRNAGWSEEVETLTPSPVVRHPNTTVPGPQLLKQQQPRLAAKFTWKDNLDKLNPHVRSSDSLRASWEAQQPPSYGQATTYGIVPTDYPVAFKDKGQGLSYQPQAYHPHHHHHPHHHVQPVSSYKEPSRQNVQLRRSPSNFNRHSFTEGFSLNPNTNANSSSTSVHDKENPPPPRMKSSVSHQKNLHHIGVYGFSPSNKHDGGGGGVSVLKHPDDRKDLVGGGGNGGVSILSKTPQEDLRHWQQLHQEELLHQHLETQALYDSPSSQTQMLSSPSLAKLSLQDEPPARWEPVRRAADNIIREKNMIIDKLKNRILELEDDYKMSETKLHQTLITNQDDGNLARQKLQELMLQNSALKERLHEEATRKDSKIFDLDIKLGAAEQEVQNMKEKLRCREAETSDFEMELAKKTQEASTWHQQVEESRQTHHSMKKKMDSLQRYLNDLPTVDESRIQAREILSLREENIGLKSKVESFEKRLGQVKKVVTARDFRLREYEEREKKLEDELSSTIAELDRLRDGDGLELSNAQEEIQALQKDKGKLGDQLDRARKLLEGTHARLSQVEGKYQSELTQMETRMTQELQAVASLRAEISTKDEQIEKMKRSIRDLGSQSQELLHQGLVARECARQLEVGNAETALSQHSTLLVQLTQCFSDLQALVKVCTKQAQGEEPDISVLLGIKEMGEDNIPVSSQLESLQSTSQLSSQLDRLRQEVNQLREDICNQYAQEMGNNLHCTTQ